MLRALMNERLTAVVEEICGLFETTIAEYEKKVSHSKEEIEQQRKLLNAVISNGVKLHNAGLYSFITVTVHTHCSNKLLCLFFFNKTIEQKVIFEVKVTI